MQLLESDPIMTSIGHKSVYIRRPKSDINTEYAKRSSVLKIKDHID